MGEIRKRITFHGRVQGVGFRYTAKLLVRLNTDHFIRIEWMDSEEIPIREDEKGFQIKY